MTTKCPECNSVFDLMVEDDAEEWFYGRISSCRRAGYHVIPIFSERCLMCHSSRDQCDKDGDPEYSRP